MEKSFLRQGMILRNEITGNIGEVRGDKNGELLDCPNWCVCVRTQVQEGVNMRRLSYKMWNLKHVEAIG